MFAVIGSARSVFITIDGFEAVGMVGTAMDRKRRQLSERLADKIYDAAVRPSAWNQVATEMASAFDASALIAINLPGSIPRQLFTAGLKPGYAERQVESLINGLPYSTNVMPKFNSGFANMADGFDGIDLASSDYYTDWMKPQDLAPHWPILHTFRMHDDLVVGGIALFRREGHNPFDDRDLEFGDTLVRHFSRAINFYATLDGVQRERLALAEVIDRLPTGVILIDSQRRPVITNRSADSIIKFEDGFRVDERGPNAVDARENATLQKLLADALECEPGHELQSTGFMAVSRPTGKRSFPMMVTPLMAAPPGSAAREAVVAIFISNPEVEETESGATSESLETLYDLTAAEAELVFLLSRGHSLEEAATARGVSIHTARSHLKHAFAKTDTNRQGELVRLILTGVSSIRER